MQVFPGLTLFNHDLITQETNGGAGGASKDVRTSRRIAMATVVNGKSTVQTVPLLDKKGDPAAGPDEAKNSEVDKGQGPTVLASSADVEIHHQPLPVNGIVVLSSPKAGGVAAEDGTTSAEVKTTTNGQTTSAHETHL